MPGLLDTCEKLFGSRNLYEVIGVHKEASASEVKRGYHRMSLRVHPDRVGEEEKGTATQKFQCLGKVYTILSADATRAVYDETGEVDEENNGLDQDRDWYEYWRILFSKVSVKDIAEFEAKYKGSSEEEADLKAAYCDYEGDMDEIMENVLCSTHEDEPRFRKILQKAVDAEQLPHFNAFSKEPKHKKKDRKRKAEKEAAEAEEMRREMGLDGDGMDALRSAIQKRGSDRAQEMDNFFSHLEAKYASGSDKKKKEKKKGKK